MANEHGGEDNITALVVRFDEEAAAALRDTQAPPTPVAPPTTRGERSSSP